jgi:Tol biopolymer transport system component
MVRPRFSLLVLLAVLALAAPAHAAFPGANGKIAFYGEAGSGTAEIYVVNPDGTGETALTSNHTTGVNMLPAWSPDGRRIAFTHHGDIYVMNADGSGVSLIFDAQFDNASLPAWSPEGQRIAFTGRPSGPADVFVINADGTGLRQLTTRGSEDDPAWSPDGQKIAFVDGEGLKTMNAADGSGTTLLVAPTSDGPDAPDWSPDGSKIAFDESTGVDSDGDPCCPDVFVVNRNGGAVTRLTTTSGTHPAWSPDGQKIVYEHGGAIWTMNADGTGQTRIAPTDPSVFTGSYPDWQPIPGSSPAPSYETPKLASPIRMSLVPVFKQCGTGGNPVNGSHSPPLSVGSCAPQPSGVAHFGPQGKGTVWIAPIYGDTNPSNGDQADVTYRLSLSDIRTAAGADYDPSPTGADASLVTRLRFTDRSNGGSGTDPATMIDLDFLVPFACTATSDPAVGSNCALDTSADSVNPGMIKENKATVLQVFRMRVTDAGANGVRGDGDDKLFASEGVFVP